MVRKKAEEEPLMEKEEEVEEEDQMWIDPDTGARRAANAGGLKVDTSNKPSKAYWLKQKSILPWQRKEKKLKKHVDIRSLFKKVKPEDLQEHRKMLKKKESIRAARMTMSLKRTKKEKKKAVEKRQKQAKIKTRRVRPMKELKLAKAAPGRWEGENFVNIPIGSCKF